ncbi:MAG TPA: fructosamine kinase family protein [Usitatibacter sp.]|nr:fructosamine kinase family protein [Usitatibacter sp.]
MKPYEAIAQKLALAISDATEALFEPAAVEPVGGGCIHTALAISGEMAGEEHRYFAKVNEADRAPMFAAEAHGLAALREADCVAVPHVVVHGHDDDHAWLVLQWLDLGSLDEHAAANLGVALAAQHRKPQEKFGWARDNFIGASVQSNGWSGDWLAFWREKRLMAQLRLAARNRLASRMIDRGERLAADCEAFFGNYVPAKSLLHGDLWNGNAAAIEGRAPVVFDPAVYVGDREADLAMTELFGGFPGDFIAAYRAAWALDDGYSVRRDFYNLYHVLNHANLFAGGYVLRAQQSIEQLLAEIR